MRSRAPAGGGGTVRGALVQEVLAAERRAERARDLSLDVGPQPLAARGIFA